MDPVRASYTCPDCNTVTTAADTDVVIHCPQCGGQFFRPAPDDPAQAEYSSPAPDESSAREDQLSGQHIRQITIHRRAAIRARSYCIIGAAACAVIGVQLVFMMHDLLRAAATARPFRAMFAGEGILILGLIWGAFHLLGHAIALTRELRQSALDEPADTPDFSNLSDGSQYARNLEEIGKDG